MPARITDDSKVSKSTAYAREYRAKSERYKTYVREYVRKNRERNKLVLRAWREKNKEAYQALYKHHNHKQRFKRYGISFDEFQKILEGQDWKCPICDCDLSQLKPSWVCIDHCHTTSKVRGILCKLCNVGLGSFKDNLKSLERAILYLSRD